MKLQQPMPAKAHGLLMVPQGNGRLKMVYANALMTVGEFGIFLYFSKTPSLFMQKINPCFPIY